MKKILVILLLSVVVNASSLPIESVVKVFSSNAISNYKYPWQTPKIINLKGTGVIIKDNMILTSAHIVSGTRFVELKKENDSKKYKGKLKYISNQADLAIIEVEDKSFFENTKALELNEDIKTRDEVTVLGYPIGGSAVSTTTGIISRIEYAKYVWSKEYLLAMQVDAAINPGNSGGPAIDKNGDIIGIAMMGLKNSDNISYIVPSVIINTFLEDIKDGKVDGFERTQSSVNYIRNENVKDYYGIEKDQGVLVSKTDYEIKDFKENDIILEIDGAKVANDGTIDSKYGRVNATLLMHQKQLGDTVKVKVLRDKKIVTFEHTLKKTAPLIKKEFETQPRYLIFGGLTFTPMTKNYMSSITNNNSGLSMIFYGKEKSKSFTEPVIWMQAIFPHKVNRGYYSGGYVVNNINGIKVKNFKHFVSLIDNIKSEFVIIETLHKQKIILNVKKAKDSFNDLKKIYSLTTDRRVE